MTDLLFEDGAVGRCLVAPDGSILRANEVWLRATGRTLDEVVGEDAMELFPEVLDLTAALHARARAGHHVEVPSQPLGTRGTGTWWEGSIDPVPMENGTGLLITLRRFGARAEQSARAGADTISEPVGVGLIEAFFANSPGIVNVLDEELRYVKADGVTAAYFGLDRESIEGRRLEDLAPAFYERFGPVLRRVVETGVPEQNVETFAELPNRPGDVRHWMSSYFAVPLGGGRRGLGVVGVEITGLRRAEQALRASEERLRRLYDSGMIGVLHFDLDGAITEANDKFLSIIGYTRAELEEGRIAWDRLTPPEYRALDAHAISELKSAGVDTPYEKEYLRKDGSRVPILIGAATYDEARHRGIAFVIDISARKHAEAALREAEERARSRAAELQLVLDTVPAAVWLAHDRQGNTITANRYGTELLRARRGSNVSVTAGPDERPRNFIPMKDGRALEGDDLPIQAAARFGREFRDFEFDLVFDDGSVRHLLGNSSPLRDLAGEPRGSVGAFIDITERKLAEARSESLARFPEENPDPVIRLDAAMNVLHANRPALDELADFDVAVGRPAPARLADPARSALAGMARVNVELPAGEKVFSVNFVPVGHEVNVYGQDITSRRRAEEALRNAIDDLRAADRRKIEFIAVLSHELRNPLAPIRNGIQILDLAVPGSEQSVRAKAIIRRQTEHLTRLVDDLLDVMRIETGKVVLQRARVDLRDVVRTTTDDLRSVFEQAGVELHVEHVVGPVWLDADRTRISQILANLLQNAAKFTPRGGTVRVSVRVDRRLAELRVRDTGVGMTPEVIARVFEPFGQAEQTLARTTGGLGLGLALVRGLTELHGGTAEARSDGTGRGSEFVVRLPLADAPVRAADREEAARSPVSRDVLVIEDNPDAAQSLADVLVLAGHRVAVATEGRTGIALAREMRPDVVFCDIGLPGLSGYDVARELRRDDTLRGTRLVALTGYAQPDDRERAREAGFDAHVAKPPGIDELMNALAFD